MGGVDSWFDELDERKVSTDEYGRYAPPQTTTRGNTTRQTEYQSPCL